jgi:hypothetical protein
MPRKAATKKIRNKNELPATPKKVVKKKAAPKKESKKKVEKPFGDGTLSSAAFFGMIRSCLRRKSMYWPSISKVRKAAQIPYTGPNKRMKYLYVCGECGEAKPSVECNVHHKMECGSLSSFDDIGGFVERLFCNSDGLILLCNVCHSAHHKK